MKRICPTKHFLRLCVLVSLRLTQIATLSVWSVKITITCLTYLLFDLFARGHCLDDNEMTNRLQEHPFLRYAARSWGHHAYGDPETQISNLILKFLGQRTHVTSAVQVMLVTDYSFEGYSQKFPRQAPAL